MTAKMTAEIPVVILAGGAGTRLKEQTEFIPKPMVPIGERPILWHIMKLYAHYGYCKFIICVGYKGEVIKDYFLHFDARTRDFTINLADGTTTYHTAIKEDWSVTIVDTSQISMTGHRLWQIQKFIAAPTFFLTYGDAVADIDIASLLSFHKQHGKFATVTGVRPPSRFGELVVEGSEVRELHEKPLMSSHIINGGFFVFSKAVFDYLEDAPECTLEKTPLERLASDSQLMVYQHKGFWHCMDNPRDWQSLQEYWSTRAAPWKIWT